MKHGIKLQLFALLFVIALVNLCQKQAFAQGFLVNLDNTINDMGIILTEDSAGLGNPLPDCTPIYIYQDANNNGYDCTDLQPQVCPFSVIDSCSPGYVNYNTISMNGEAELGVPGIWITGQAMISTGNQMLPGTNSFYVVVPIPNTNPPKAWVSDSTGIVTAFPTIFNFSRFSYRTLCPNVCRPPLKPILFATSTECDRVTLTWEACNTDIDIFYLFRNNALIHSQAASLPNIYHDIVTFSQDGYFYSIRGRKSCSAAPGDTSLSSFSSYPISPLQGPPIATDLVATEYCDSVKICFTIPSIAAVDSFRLKRICGTDTTTVARRYRPTAPGTYCLADRNAHTTACQYYVVGWSSTCQEGLPSTQVSAQRLAKPPVVTGVNATDNECGVVHITWPDVSNEESYKIQRTPTLVEFTVPANTTSYDDATGTVDFHYAYKVIAA